MRWGYTYDANGNLLSKTNGSGTTSYAWDLRKLWETPFVNKMPLMAGGLV